MSALVCALRLIRVTALGLIDNATGDEIDMVALQHEIAASPGCSNRLSKMDTLFRARSTAGNLRHGP